MEIDGRPIGADQPPYVIAEISNNHLADADRACRMIELAAKIGADAVKIQTYDADALTIDCKRPEFIVKTPPWEGISYYELYKNIALPRRHTKRLFRVARDCGITIFSSPFDESAVELLEALHCPAYKIASFEICDDPLLRAVGATGRPVLVSTGVANMAQIQETVRVLRSSGCPAIALLHCISEYPADTRVMNIRVMDRLAALHCTVGLSDHSLNNIAAILAVSRGGAIIEKHFTISRSDGGPDASFSLEPKEMEELIRVVREAWQALGDARVLDLEKRPGAEHARSLFIVKKVTAGERLRPEHVRAIRPGCGLAPRELPRIIGRRVRRDLERGEPLSWDDIA